MKKITYQQLRPYYKPLFMSASALGVIIADVQGLHWRDLAHWPYVIIKISVDVTPALLAGWIFAKIAASGVLDWPKR